QGGEKAETPASPRNSTDYPLKEGKFLTVRDRLHGAKCHAGRCPVDGIRQLFMEHPFAIREVKRIVSQRFFSASGSDKLAKSHCITRRTSREMARMSSRSCKFETTRLVTSSSSCSRSFLFCSSWEARRRAVKFKALSKASAIRSAA